MNHPTDLTAIEDAAWELLVRGVDQASHGFHLPTLATVGQDGRPDVRIVVLREADRASRTLTCHTDARSPKLDMIRNDPRVGWLFYDRECKVQLRVEAGASVHTGDAVADARWAASTPSSRRCYLAPHPPSRAVPSYSPNLPLDVRGGVPGEDRLEDGRAHFAAIRAAVESIDYLHLAHDGHRRARLVYDSEAGGVERTWLTP